MKQQPYVRPCIRVIELDVEALMNIKASLTDTKATNSPWSTPVSSPAKSEETTNLWNYEHDNLY